MGDGPIKRLRNWLRFGPRTRVERAVHRMLADDDAAGRSRLIGLARIGDAANKKLTPAPSAVTSLFVAPDDMDARAPFKKRARRILKSRLKGRERIHVIYGDADTDK